MADKLWFHQGNAQWCCKRKGKFFYFGTDKDAAEKAYEAGREFYDRGFHPPQGSTATLVRDLLNEFHDHQEQRCSDGEIAVATYQQWRKSCDYIAAGLDKMLPIADLKPSHFEAMRRVLSKRLGPGSLGSELSRCRQIFNWGYQNEIVDVLPRFGTSLRRPPKRELRKLQGNRARQLYSPDEIRRLLDAAALDLRAMILLGINCGFGPGDVGRLQTTDIRDEWLDANRAKTGVERRAWLWPETRSAMKDYKRPTAECEEVANYVFLTRNGKPYCKIGARSATGEEVGRRFRRLLDKVLGDERRDRAFYDLRRTFRTRASDAKDKQAASLVMGHESGSMSALYTLETRDERVMEVCQHVRGWLLGEEGV